MSRRTSTGEHLRASLEKDITLVVGSNSSKKEIPENLMILKQAGYFEASLPSTKRFELGDVNSRQLKLLIKALYFGGEVDEAYDDDEAGAPEAEDFVQMLDLGHRFAFPPDIMTGVLGHLKRKIVWGQNTLLVIAEAYRLGLDRQIPMLVESFLTNVTQDLETIKKDFAALQEKAADMVHAFRAKAVVIKKVSELVQSAPAPNSHVKICFSCSDNTIEFMCKADEVSAASDKILQDAQAVKDLLAFLSAEMMNSAVQMAGSVASSPNAEAGKDEEKQSTKKLLQEERERKAQLKEKLEPETQLEKEQEMKEKQLEMAEAEQHLPSFGYA